MVKWILERSGVLTDDVEAVVLELGNVLTPGSLRVPVKPRVLALVLALMLSPVPALVVLMFMAGNVLTMVGFPSGPCETPNNGATLDVPTGLLKTPAKYVTICTCVLVKKDVVSLCTMGPRLDVLKNEGVG